jgi:hypothetical protein
MEKLALLSAAASFEFEGSCQPQNLEQIQKVLGSTRFENLFP